jgi:CBS domain-containing protein
METLGLVAKVLKENVLKELRVLDVLDKSHDVPRVAPATGFESVRTLLLDCHHSTVPVVSEEGALLGLINADQIRPVMDDRQLDGFVLATDICTAPVWLYRDDDLSRAHQLFRRSGCSQIPVFAGPRSPLNFACFHAAVGPTQKAASMLGCVP